MWCVTVAMISFQIRGFFWGESQETFLKQAEPRPVPTNWTCVYQVSIFVMHFMYLMVATKPHAQVRHLQIVDLVPRLKNK